MQTQDDTFERLKRIPYEEMATIVSNFNVNRNGRDKEELVGIMKSCGWTSDVYHIEWARKRGF